MNRSVMIVVLAVMGCLMIWGNCFGSGKRPVEKLPVDPEVEKFLEKEILEIIGNPDIVYAWKTDLTRKTGGGQSIQGFPVITPERTLSADQVSEIQALIVKADSYEFGMQKRTRLRPSHALSFLQGKEHVDILLDLNSSQWGFIHNGKMVQEDIRNTTALPELTKNMDSVFNK